MWIAKTRLLKSRTEPGVAVIITNLFFLYAGRYLRRKSLLPLVCSSFSCGFWVSAVCTSLQVNDDSSSYGHFARVLRGLTLILCYSKAVYVAVLG